MPDKLLQKTEFPNFIRVIFVYVYLLLEFTYTLVIKTYYEYRMLGNIQKVIYDFS